MSHMNRVIIMGNLAADPELKHVGGGRSLARMRVAVNRSWRGTDGTQQKRVDFFAVTAWSTTAENCARYLKKGRPVLVEGGLSTNSWDGPDGKKRWTTEITAHAVHFLNSRDTPPTAPTDTPPGKVVAEPEYSANEPHPMHAAWDDETSEEEETGLSGPGVPETESSNGDGNTGKAARGRPVRGTSARRGARSTPDEVPF